MNLKPFSKARANKVADTILAMAPGIYTLTQLHVHLETSIPEVMNEYMTPRATVSSIANAIGRMGLVGVIRGSGSHGNSFEVMAPIEVDPIPEPIALVTDPRKADEPVTLELLSQQIAYLTNMVSGIKSRLSGAVAQDLLTKVG